MSGDVTYNGRTFSEFQPLRTASYVEQVDNKLIPEMTVRETLDFSARCQGSGVRKGGLAHFISHPQQCERYRQVWSGWGPAHTFANLRFSNSGQAFWGAKYRGILRTCMGGFLFGQKAV